MKCAALPDQTMMAAFMATVHDRVYFMDRESRIVAASLSLAQLLGCTIDDVLGKTFSDFLDHSQAAPYMERYVNIMRTGEALIDLVDRDTWPDGRVTWSQLSIVPVRDDSGQIIGVFTISRDITAAKLMEQALEKANRDLREMSRRAGMADAAGEVVHSVGNVLNSVNVSIGLLADGLRKLKVQQLGKLADLLRQHADDLAGFMTHNSQGRHVIDFIASLHTELSANQAGLLDEVGSLEQSVGHIKDIVTTQQSYAAMGKMVEDIEIGEVVEEALRMSQGSFIRLGIRTERKCQPVPKITGDRGKTLQILNDLYRNAEDAVENLVTEKRIETHIEAASNMVRVIIRDNGVGIPPENLTRIFGQGFTTRAGGFGLHWAANAAKEMHGSLVAHSEGLGKGASFVLELLVSQSTQV